MEFRIADTFTTPDPAPLAERLRGAVATTPQGITASIGVATAGAGPQMWPELLKAADAALYRAKDSGRDRVCAELQAVA